MNVDPTFNAEKMCSVKGHETVIHSDILLSNCSGIVDVLDKREAAKSMQRAEIKSGMRYKTVKSTVRVLLNTDICLFQIAAFGSN